MMPYLDHLRHVRTNGKRKPTRATLTSTGEKVHALSVFGAQARYPLGDGFPLLTTKKVPFRSVVHELVWFLSGDTNVRYLRENGVHIWDRWAAGDGSLGPVYGGQWRDFGGVDQVSAVIEDIRSVKADPTHPAARRLIVTAWNPPDIPKMRLPPCHMTFQLMVDGDHLHCQLYQRSADLFLGVPFNIASYALLTHVIARHVGLTPGDFIHTIGDAHIYENHLEQVDEQLARTPKALPRILLHGPGTDPLDFRADDVTLVGYRPAARLRGEVAV